nr:unnamed protein product [Callosobruchus chinensis]
MRGNIFQQDYDITTSEDAERLRQKEEDSPLPPYLPFLRLRHLLVIIPRRKVVIKSKDIKSNQG